LPQKFLWVVLQDPVELNQVAVQIVEGLILGWHFSEEEPGYPRGGLAVSKPGNPGSS